MSEIVKSIAEAMESLVESGAWTRKDADSVIAEAVKADANCTNEK